VGQLRSIQMPSGFLPQCRSSGIEEWEEPWIPFTRWDDKTSLCAKWTLMDYIRLALRLAFLGSFRLIVLTICAFCFFSSFFLFTISASTPSPFQTISPWRRRLLLFGSRCLGGIFFWAWGFEIRVKKSAPISAGVIVCNHISYIDFMILFLVLDGPSFVGKKEMVQLPLTKRVGDWGQCLYVDRDREKSAQSDSMHVPSLASASTSTSVGASSGSIASGITLRQQLHAAARAEGKVSLPPLVIFPEGTTTNGSAILTFKSGAFQSSYPVQPVTIAYHSAWWNPSFESIWKWRHLLYSLTCPKTVVVIHILPVLKATAKEARNPSLFAEHARRVIASDLQLPLVEMNLRDKQEYHRRLIRRFQQGKNASCNL